MFPDSQSMPILDRPQCIGRNQQRFSVIRYSCCPLVTTDLAHLGNGIHEKAKEQAREQPATTIAKGFCVSLPTPADNLRQATSAVFMMGRSRNSDAAIYSRWLATPS